MDWAFTAFYRLHLDTLGSEKSGSTDAQCCCNVQTTSVAPDAPTGAVDNLTHINRKKMQKFLKLPCIVAIGLSVAGCQSQRQSYDNAFVTCSTSGMYEGTYAHDRCTQRVYDENRRKSDQAAATVAAGVAVGAVGAYAIAKHNERDRDREWSRRDRRWHR